MKNKKKKGSKKTSKISTSLTFIGFVSILALSLFYLKYYTKPHNQKPIVVIIPSYNNIKWYNKNLGMLAAQDYKNWRAIYIDDCSTDGTGDAAEKFIKDHELQNKIQLIKNKVRCGAMANFYRTIHTCQDHEIIVVCDGDDWFKHEGVLSYVNKVYQDNNVWMTYGQYEQYPSGKLGLCEKIPDVVVNHNNFRNYKWLSSHLRTFYAGLFKKIKKEDFMLEGKFLPATVDMAAMFPMLEMAGPHSKFIPKTLYVYNMTNPLNNYKKRLNLQLYLNQFIRGKQKYNRINAITT